MGKGWGTEDVAMPQLMKSRLNCVKQMMEVIVQAVLVSQPQRITLGLVQAM